MSESRTVLHHPFLIIALAAGCGSGPSASGPDAGSPDAGTAPGSDGGNSDVPFTDGVSTLAGWSTAAYADGPRSAARFSNPVNVAYRGVVYVADFDNGAIRAIDTGTYVTSTVFTQATFQRPFALAFGTDGALYVATDNDKDGNHSAMTGTVWRVDVTAGTATVVANAIGRPRGLVALTDGRLALSDYQHQVIETLDPSNGQLAIVAGAWDSPGLADGDGATARFSTPYGLALRPDGTLAVADYDNSLIRIVALDGATATLTGMSGAGFTDGAVDAARFNHPEGIATVGDDIYVTDSANFRIRRISGGQVETVAGNGVDGYVDADDRLASEMHGLEGLTATPDGSMLYLADGNRGEDAPYDRVRQIKLP